MPRGASLAILKAKATSWAGAATLGLMMVLPNSSMADAKICASAKEFRALNARVLQTELMVAALSCGEKGNYNSFVKRHQKTLIREGQVMTKFFARVYGKGHRRKVDKFVTRLANEASKRSHGQDKDNYCEQAKILFLEVLTTEPKKLGTYFTESRYQTHGVKSCTDQSVATAPKKKK